ncbi:TPA: hypothetical protein ACX6PU_003737 [Photobacterium damselae]
MTVLIGDMEPNLGADLANSLDEDVLILTQYLSSFIYYKLNIINKRVNIIYIKDYINSEEYNDKYSGLIDEIAIFYDSLYDNKKDDRAKNILGVINQVELVLNKFTIKTVILWNVVSAMNAAIYNLLDRNNVNLNILENGFFRPDTITLDYLGLNVNSAYYKYGGSVEKLNKYKLRECCLQPKKKYLKFRLLEFLPIWPLNNAYYSIGKIVKKRFLKKNNIHANYDSISSCRYVFLPLQLIEDSQNVYYSNYMNYLDIIKDSLKLIDGNDFKLVIKPHPLDLNIKECIRQINSINEGNIIISNGDTKYLIENSEFVICVNSTVGFEALLCNKYVYLLGQAMYEKLNGVNGVTIGDNVEKFRSKTQIDFNINSYTRIDNLIEYFK